MLTHSPSGMPGWPLTDSERLLVNLASAGKPIRLNQACNSSARFKNRLAAGLGCEGYTADCGLRTADTPCQQPATARLVANAGVANNGATLDKKGKHNAM